MHLLTLFKTIPSWLIFIIIYFTFYSFVGWIVELIYRSFTQKRLINPGFLYGFFVPIYGFGALIIISIEPYIKQYNIFVETLIYGVILTVIEYIVGLASEKFFGIVLWDYSDNKFNIHGRVCLKFSIGWAILAESFLKIIHPFIANLIGSIGYVDLILPAFVFLIYFAVDFIFSSIKLSNLHTQIQKIYDGYLSKANININEVLLPFKRLTVAFPNITKNFAKNMGYNLKGRVGNLVKDVNEKLVNLKTKKNIEDNEYREIVDDILSNSEFQRLKDFHHHNSSIFVHALRVSFLAYKISKFLKFDYVSTARGGLLHDFFLYDWRNHDLPDLAKEKYHGFEHPKIALKNSEKLFKVNNIEKDIILKHMWPLTFIPPKYKESFVVTFSDKYIASQEFLDSFKQNKKNKK